MQRLMGHHGILGFFLISTAPACGDEGPLIVVDLNGSGAKVSMVRSLVTRNGMPARSAVVLPGPLERFGLRLPSQSAGQVQVEVEGLDESDICALSAGSSGPTALTADTVNVQVTLVDLLFRRCPSQRSAINRIFGFSDSDVWLAGNAGLLVHFEAGVLTSMPSGVSSYISGIWGSAPNNVWFSGGNGLLLRYTGAAQVFASPQVTTRNLNAIFGTSEKLLWAVGDGGTILGYADGTWAPQSSGTSKDLYGLWAYGEEAWAVGKEGTIVHRKGGQWQTEASNVQVQLNAVWGTGPSDIWVVGQSGTLLHFSGGSWRAEASGVQNDSFLDIWGRATDDWFAVGTNGLILQQRSAQRMTFSAVGWSTPRWQAVWGSRGGDLWLGGALGPMEQSATGPVGHFVPPR